MKKNKINIGVIGLGVGLHHLNSYIKNKSCNVIHICDFDSKKLKKIKKNYPYLNLTKNYKDIINDKSIDIVSIASYDNYHFKQIKDCLNNKKHVFVEKPICLLPKELKIIKNLQKKTKCVISSNLVLRTTPLFNKVKKEILKKDFEKIYYVESDYLWGRAEKFNQWRSGVKNYSIILGAAIHMIDLIIWILDMKPEYVTAYSNNTGSPNIKFNTFAILLLRFKSGLIVKITGNGPSVHDHFHGLKIFSNNKTLIHDLRKTETLIKKNKKFISKKLNNLYPGKEHRTKIINNFVDHIINRKNKLIIDKKNIYDVMEICFAAEKSIRLNKTIKITY